MDLNWQQYLNDGRTGVIVGRLLAEHRIDSVILVPTMMHRIWRLDPALRAKYDLSALRMMLHMAAPCPPWLKREWINWLGPERVHELYAGTEFQAAPR